MKMVVKKISPKFFKDINKIKCFEIRKDDDGIEIGDIVMFREWNGKKYTGRECMVEVTYILRNVPEYGLKDGYCIFCWQGKPCEVVFK